MKSARRPAFLGLGSVIGLALALRFALLVAILVASGRAGFLTTDSSGYLALADSLASAGRFARDERAEVYRTPAYPLLLAVGVASGQPLAVALAVQALLGAATAALAVLAARNAAGEHIAPLAGLICACDPVLLLWGAKITPEALLTLFVAVAGWAMSGYVADGRRHWLLLAVASAAAAAYARPVAYLLAPWLVLMAALLGPVPARRRRDALLMLLGAVLMLGPWHARNALVAGYPGFSRQFDHWLGASAHATVERSPEREQRRALREELLERDPTTPQADGVVAQHTRQRLLVSPLRFVANHLLGSLATLLHPGAMAWLETFGVYPSLYSASRALVQQGYLAALPELGREAPLVLVVQFLLLVPTLLLLGLALLALRRAHGGRQRVVHAGIVLYFALASGGPWGQSRFRHPLLPSLAVLAAAALARGPLQRVRGAEAA